MEKTFYIVSVVGERESSPVYTAESFDDAHKYARNFTRNFKTHTRITPANRPLFKAAIDAE